MTDVDTNGPPPEVEADVPARLSDFVLFFFGRRESILRMVDSNGGLWLAAALVLSAALPREYDAESLVHEPWHLLGPFGASIILASVLFLFTQWCRLTAKQQIGDALDDYRAFLTGYWLTAPLAWFYAVPVESITDEVAAVKYNLTALSIVSLWRVFLFSRMVSVRFQLPYWVTIVWIGLACSLIGFVAAFQSLTPMISIMGGLRLTEAQIVVRDFQSGVVTILFYAIPVLLVTWIVSFVVLAKRSNRSEHTPAIRHRLSKSLWLIPCVALLLLSCAAWKFQPPLYRARVVDNLLNDEKLEEAVAKLTSHRRIDYPPVWDPPPTFPLGDSRTPSFENLIDVLIVAKAPPWVNDLLLHQSSEILLRQSEFPFGASNLDRVGRQLGAYSEENWQQIERTIKKLQQIEVGDEQELEVQEELLEHVEKWRAQRESENSDPPAN